jgi:hypothetical protein
MKDRASRDGELIAALIAIELIAFYYAGYFVRSASRTFNPVLPFEGFKILAAFCLIAIALNEINKTNFHRTPPL